MAHLHLQFRMCSAFPLTISELTVRALRITALPCFSQVPTQGCCPRHAEGWSWGPRATLTSGLLWLGCAHSASDQQARS